ncbi:Wzz/FepE/Etk N-terminal domain-containing protein [Spiribacter roseus]|uniref:Wzz/FepE/Etk N-terminal domain-containing protein n=1 Tax=Spiribacter roseus TaxID=1855875 RepID=UPI00132F7E1C|nr:Wzz/FepE/Etk N-terminal domain-containing protein [Spiribacter roseus]KAF0281726.1 hypothetical protein BA900_03090 [Spiribacter roseus]
MTDEQGTEGRYPANRRTQETDFPIAGPYPADDEISLYDLWEVLRRRRLTILVVFLLVVIGSVGYGLTKESVYSVESFIEIGRVPETDGEIGLLENPSTAVSRLTNVLIPTAREDYLGENEGLPAIESSVSDEAGGLIRLSAEVPERQAEVMQRFMVRVADDLARHYASERQKTLRQIDDRIASLDRRLQEMSSTVSSSESVLRNAPAGMASSGQDTDSGSMAIAEMLRDVLAASLLEDRQADYWALDDRLAALKSARARAVSTSIEREATISERPVGTGTSLILALGAILGLMLGVFAAFIREFLANARAYREQPDPDQT